VLIVVFRRLGTLEQPEALIAWVATTARREALRHGRSTEHEPLPDKTAAPLAPELDLRDTLATLPAPQRDVLLLRELIGLSEQETADVLLIPRGTVKSRLHRGRQAFREAWSR
jgi:RNA polymerase sigma factor (sigma-70 family)